MSKDASFFNNPFFLGFEHLEKLLENVAKSSDSYPPYNIEALGDHGFKISLAVAGFDIDDLSVELEDNKLIIKGKQSKDDETKVYLYKGIAKRQFQKHFVLAEGVQIVGADFDKGLLNIHLLKPKSNVNSKKIAITDLSKSDSVAKKALTYDIEIQ